jgi:hypothetical protein
MSTSVRGRRRMALQNEVGDSDIVVPDPADTASERPADKVRAAIAILDAISMGELLARLPKDEADQHRHETAMSLLEVVEKCLRDALAQLDSE